MATIYRGFAKDNDYRTRFMLSPTVKAEASRDSKKLAAQAVTAFLALLARTSPQDGGTAWLERSDRSGLLVLVRYSGRRVCVDRAANTWRGQWRLEVDVPGFDFPDFVNA
jgi:hypothetical protein